MLKYIKQHMAEIVGIEIYPIISFVIFFSFFIAAAVLIMKADKGFINKMSNLPLDEVNENEQK
jgi:cytochrome c oxidase cbb3-type subunit 4